MNVYKTNYIRLIAGHSPNGQTETNTHTHTNIRAPMHAHRRRRRQRDGALLEAACVPRTETTSRALHSPGVETPQPARWSSAGSHGLSTDGQPLELCRPMGESERWRKRASTEPGRHSCCALQHSPSKTKKTTQRKETNPRRS